MPKFTVVSLRSTQNFMSSVQISSETSLFYLTTLLAFCRGSVDDLGRAQRRLDNWEECLELTEEWHFIVGGALRLDQPSEDRLQEDNLKQAVD